MASNPIQNMQEEFLSNVRKSQEAVIDAIRTWVESVQSVTPKVPGLQVPGAENLPRAEDVVAGAYDFAEELLKNQRRFAEEIMKATTPLMPRDAAKSGE